MSPGMIAPDWAVVATYAYTDAQVAYDPDPTIQGKQLTNVAPHTASLFLTHDFGIVPGPFGEGRLRAGIGGRYVGTRPGEARAEHAFATLRDLHRFLLLPGEGKGWGRTITGAARSRCCSSLPRGSICAGRRSIAGASG